jgi:hypothetical protein
VGIWVVYLEWLDRGRFVKYIVAETSRLFAISSQYPAGTFARQIVWIWFMTLACLTVVIGACLSRQLTVQKGLVDDDELSEDSEVNERIALLQ